MESLEVLNTPIDWEFEVLKQQYEQIQRAHPTLFRSHRNTIWGDQTVLRALQHIAKSGCAWRDLPEEFGNWSSVHKRFSAWEEKWAMNGTFELIKKELDAIDWTALMEKHRLTRRRVLKGYAPPKKKCKYSISDADYTFIPDGLHNNPSCSGDHDGTEEKDLPAPCVTNGGEENSESTVSSAENPSELDTSTDEANLSEDKNPSHGTATQQTATGNPSQRGSDVDPSIRTGGVSGKYKATAKMNDIDNKCKVLAGSTINPTTADSLTYGAKKWREEHNDWVIRDNTFVRDWEFSSPTLAAEVVCGYKISQSLFWKCQK